MNPAGVFIPRRAEPRSGPRWEPGALPRPPQPARGQFTVAGFLDLDRHGNGGLLPEGVPEPGVPSVPAGLVRRLGLRLGDWVEALAVEDEYGPLVQTVWRVNGHGVSNLAERPDFKQLTPVHPDRRITLGYRPDAVAGRLLDLVAPIGRGQRGLIVAPPQAGKSTLLVHIAEAVSADPELELLVLLVGERPEEATEMRRLMRERLDGLVLVADLDAPSHHQAAVVNLALAHARRLTEEGRHVVVLLDSLTRLARVQNLAAPGSGRTLSGGMDASALLPLRQVFGAARATEEGGSLTLIATCLVDTGSRLDQVVYEEFKGTGNMEVHLDRRLAQRGLYPAVNIVRSGTRREALLLDEETMYLMTQARRVLAYLPEDEALAVMLDALRAYPDNRQALEALLRG
ncbi:MAG: transcription termination factor Rho [Caldilineales bacterium]|nr:transcription termination factor Rho [Caldilineales bacterium]MDW8317189.1 transcription termination factor Rho [Anaerolineae bacterium]